MIKIPKILLKNKKSIIISGLIVSIVLLIVKYYKQIEQFCAFGVIGDCNTTVTTQITDISNQLSQIDNSISQVIQQSCIDTTSATNVANIIGSSVRNTNINQQNIVKNMCALKSIFTSNVSSDLKNQVAAAIASHAEATGTLLGGAPASTDTIQTSIDNRSTYVDNSQALESIKTCMNNLSIDNIVNIIGSDVSGLGIQQINDQFKECLASDINTAELAQKMEASRTVSFDSSSSAAGGDVFKSLGQLFQGMSTGFIVVGVVLVVFFIGSFMFGSSDNGSQVLNNAINKIPGTPGYPQPPMQVPAGYQPPNWNYSQVYSPPS